MNKLVLSGQVFLDNFLQHYASKYYDPVKAHEYYLRTRQLAAKNAKSALTSKAQRDTFAVVKDSVTRAKAADVTKLQTSTQQHLDSLQQTAQATQDSIVAQLTAFVKKMNPNSVGNSAAKSAFLDSQDRIASNKARGEIQKLSSDLNTAIKSVQTEYKTAMAALVAKYNTDLANEKQKIHDQVSGVNPKRSRKNH